MAITWTIIVLGVLLPVMASEETTTVVQPTQAGSTPQPEPDITTPSTFTTKESSPTSATLEKQTDPTNPTTQPSSTQPQPTTQPKTTNPVTTAESTTQPSTAPLTTQLITTVKEQVSTAVLSLVTSVKSSSPVGPTTTNSNPVTQTSTSSINPSTNPDTTVTLHSSADLPKQPTEQITTVPQGSTDPERSKPSGEKNSSESATVSPKNAEPDSTTKLSTTQNLQTTQTAIIQRTSVQHSDASRDDKEPDTNSTKNTYKHNYINIDSTSSKESVVHEACKTLLQNLKGNCSATVEVTSKELIIKATINTEEVIPSKIYEPPVQKKEIPVDDSKWMIPDTLIAILASCGALVLILCFFAAYCTYHRRSYRKNQQHLTEELQTVENGYHDNPTLEVMEVQPEMQEKKVALNGEFNDSWIVPIDNLLKEDIPDEEDTHL